MRRRARTDNNQAPIVAALRSLGASVTSLHAVGGGCPDLLVGYDGRTLLLEVKNRSTHARRRGGARTEESQDAWLGAWRGGPARIVHDIDEAVDAVLRSRDD